MLPAGRLLGCQNTQTIFHVEAMLDSRYLDRISMVSQCACVYVHLFHDKERQGERLREIEDREGENDREQENRERRR